MDSLYALLLASALVSAASASLSIGCTRKDMAECIFPMTFQKMKFNQDFPLEMTFNEVCSNGKTCMDSFVASCLDKEAQDYWAEWGESLAQRRKEICGVTPLKNDIAKHLECYDADRVKKATEECGKVKHFTKHLVSSLLTVDNVFIGRSSPEQVEKATNDLCVRAKVFFKCTWPLLWNCDLKSKDCLLGYIEQNLLSMGSPSV